MNQIFGSVNIQINYVYINVKVCNENSECLFIGWK